MQGIPTHADLPLCLRYVDNRILMGIKADFDTDAYRHFQRLDWYEPPLMLENVSDTKVLGFYCDTDQRTMLMELPNRPGQIRGVHSVCGKNNLLSSFRSRAYFDLPICSPAAAYQVAIAFSSSPVRTTGLFLHGFVKYFVSPLQAPQSVLRQPPRFKVASACLTV